MTQTEAGPATLHFADGEFAVLRRGAFVACAVSGRAIPLEILRYWSVERQEAYAGPGEALQRAGSARQVLSDDALPGRTQPPAGSPPPTRS